jgi:hypothetical protein
MPNPVPGCEAPGMSFIFVLAEVRADSRFHKDNGVVRPRAGLFLLDDAPQPPDECVVRPGTLAEPNPDAGPIESPDEFDSGQLTVPVSIDELGPFKAPQDLVQHLDATINNQGSGAVPHQHLVTASVHDRHEVEGVTGGRRIRNVIGPNLVELVDHEDFRKVQTDLPQRQRCRRVNMDSHRTNRRLNTIHGHMEPRPQQLVEETTRPHPRRGRVRLVDPRYEAQIFHRCRLPLVIQRREGPLRQLALPHYAQF